jgi:peptidoglycan/LPS O-acetylase OafA/YrhL
MFPTGVGFREDINGLRAVAVLSVVLYHLGVRGFGGGYVGVDVFFVLSGFLMTQMIAGKLAGGRFSLADFYAARARRIVPALAALLVVLLVLGNILLLPHELADLGRSAASSIAFLSNIVYWRQQGYFETPSHANWLLHTWSLSVEWQFYLLYPLFLMALQALRGGRYLRHGVVAALLVSLALCLVATPRKPEASFFLLPTRSWEMLAGGVVYLFGDRLRLRPALPVGLAMIVAAALFYRVGLPYPGHFAILPVLGTALVVAARSPTVLLANAPAQLLGNISYSVYLWHWPLVVGARYLGLPFSAVTTTAIIAASVGLGYLSYRAVELPMKRLGGKVPGRSYLARCFSVCAVIAAVGLIDLRSGGLPGRVPPLVARNDLAATHWEYPGRCVFQDGFCHLGPDAPHRVLFWGDSHVEQLYPALAALLDRGETRGRQLIIASRDGCLPVRGFDGEGGRRGCRQFNQRVLDRALQGDVDAVVIASIWAPYFRERLYDLQSLPTVCATDGDRCLPVPTQADGLARAGAQLGADLRALVGHGKAVHLVLPVPAYDHDVASYLARQQWRGRPVELRLTRAQHQAATGDMSSLLRRLAAETGASVIDPAEVLCAGGECRFAEGGVALYRDNNHLAAEAAPLVAPLFREVFRLDQEPPR